MSFGAGISDQNGQPNVRTLIVDDEPLARSNLRLLLRHHTEIEIIGECSSGQKAIEDIRNQKPDLLFLDVQMPEFDGFDVLEKLGQNLPPALVFVTAYDEYALRAFDAGALDYLLKPFDNARFERMLARAKERIFARDKERFDRSGSSRQIAERLVIKERGQVLFLKPSEIDWIEAADYYACLHVGPRNHLLRRTMAELEKELNATIFCRVHRSAIVNLQCVHGLELNPDGENEVILKNGVKLPLSRRYRKEVEARLGIPAR